MRYSAVLGQPGKLRTIGLAQQRQFAGSYRDTLNNPGVQPRYRADPDRAVSSTATSSISSRSITDDIGVFGRWSWNDGKTEIMAFTDIDASLALGTVDEGHAMGPAGRQDRPRRRGQRAVAAIIATSSRPAASALLIGDGMLNYRHERILETLLRATR